MKIAHDWFDDDFSWICPKLFAEEKREKVVKWDKTCCANFLKQAGKDLSDFMASVLNWEIWEAHKTSWNVNFK